MDGVYLVACWRPRRLPKELKRREDEMTVKVVEYLWQRLQDKFDWGLMFAQALGSCNKRLVKWGMAQCDPQVVQKLFLRDMP